jgi:hypothetical protein
MRPPPLRSLPCSPCVTAGIARAKLELGYELKQATEGHPTSSSERLEQARQPSWTPLSLSRSRMPRTGWTRGICPVRWPKPRRSLSLGVLAGSVQPDQMSLLGGAELGWLLIQAERSLFLFFIIFVQLDVEHITQDVVLFRAFYPPQVVRNGPQDELVIIELPQHSGGVATDAIDIL